MTERKKLAIKPASEQAEAPGIKKKGRGWEISEKRLDALHDHARDMRRHASPAHKALAAKFAKADFGRYSFKRFAVVGSAIVDFNCHQLGMAIVIDEEDTPEALVNRRDKSLESVGIRVMHLRAQDVLENMDAVLERITLGMRKRIGDKRDGQREHRERSTPKDRYSQGRSDRHDGERYDS